jgi:isoquinoline 1-oxidoreductase beta subunit
MKTVKNPIDRRKFLKLSGASAAILAIGFYIPDGASAAEAKAVNLKDLPEGFTGLNAFIEINEKGEVIIYNHKPEMGQGTWQSMPALIAEELNLDFEQVQVKMAIASPAYGNMTVGGSSSVRLGFMPMRRVGAAAKAMLLMAAAETWKVPLSELDTDKGIIHHPKSGKSGHFGEFVSLATSMKAPEQPELKAKKDWKILGRKVLRPDVNEKVDGSGIFGIDVKVDSMVYATTAHHSLLTAKIKGIDDSATKAVAGVRDVLQVERRIFGNTTTAVAVVADTYYAAVQGYKKLKIDWDSSKDGAFNTDKVFEDLKKMTGAKGAIHTDKGNVEQSLSEASEVLERTYATPFLAHSPMEPMNVTVHIKGETCEIWAPTQVSNRAQQEAATYLGIPPENVTLHTTYLGGGFGRRLFTDFLYEALDLAKQLNKPVKLIWTREEDTISGPFRPGMVYHSRAALNSSGQVQGWEEKVIGPSISFNINPNADTSGVDRGAMECISDSHYPVEHFRTHFVHYPVPIALGWWRSVYASTNVFAHECFFDELAEKAGEDPLAYRKRMLAAEPRFVKVLEKVEEMSGWGKNLPEGTGMGVAIARSFGSICAHVVQVSRKEAGGGMDIDHVWTALDCGTYVNPDTVKGQTEGNIVMALTAALRDGITFKNGEAQQTNFHNYRMLRINETPPMTIEIMENDENPGGVGEPGFPPLAPALANAVYAVSGTRIYSLPFNLNQV